MRFRREIMVGICFVGFGLGGVGGRHLAGFWVERQAYLVFFCKLFGVCFCGNGFAWSG